MNKKGLCIVVLCITMAISSFGLEIGAYSAQGVDLVEHNCNGVPVEPENPQANALDLYLTENFATNYFYALEENFGNNTVGSCTYIAAGMLLSYFDVYWDDGIVPEVYKEATSLTSYQNIFSEHVESPGSKRESSTIANATPDTIYFQLCQQYAADYLHCNLIQMGYSHGFVSLPNSQTPTSSGGSDSSEDENHINFGLSTYNCKVVIETFLGDKKDLFDIQYITENVRDKAIEYIKSGIPVLMSVYSVVEGDYIGHSVIAYDYDEVQDQIYVHMGWDNATHSKVADFDYANYGNLLVLIPKEEYNHSCTYYYNKTLTSGDIENVCACTYGKHPAHVHEKRCYSLTLEKHDFQCEICDERIQNEPHTNEYYMNYEDSSTHIRRCVYCGYSVTRGHVVAPGSGFLRAPCVYCGAMVDLSGSLVPIQGIGNQLTPMQATTPGTYTLSDGTVIRILSASGSYLLPDGTIVLSEADLRAFLEGSLDPYAWLDTGCAGEQTG